jgi:MFS transporter, DHA3 family, macrolide efflux protein
MKRNSILSSYFLAEFGRAMYFVMITWILYDMTKDPYYTGILVSIGFLPGLLLNFLIGVLVDRLNRKRLAIIANFSSALVLIYLLSTILLDALHPVHIFIVHMVLQVSGSLLRPSIQAFVAEIFPKKLLPSIYSKAGSAGIIGGLLGASIGGLVIAHASYFIAMSIPFTAFVLATIAIVFIPQKENNQMTDKEKASIFRDLLSGFSYVKHNRLLINLFMMMFIGQLVFHTSIGFLSAYTSEFLNKSATIYGLLDATVSVGGALAGMLGAWWWKTNKNKLHIRAFVIIFVGLLCSGVSSHIVFSFVGFFLIGLGTTWIRVLLQSVQQIATDASYHGRMASFRMICNQGSVVISGPILGWIASHWGTNTVYLALAVPVLLGILGSFVLARSKEFIDITSET